MFDWWSVPHLAAGITLGLLVGPWWTAFGMVIGYEIFEAGLRRWPGKRGGLFEYESWANIAGDVLLGMGGWVIGSLSPWRFVVVPWG